MKHLVNLSKVKKHLKKLPNHILRNLQVWSEQVELLGLTKVRKTKSYHDEPLKGTRKGQRSVRLSKSYRCIYETAKSGDIVIVEVQEVNKHEY